MLTLTPTASTMVHEPAERAGVLDEGGMRIAESDGPRHVRPGSRSRPRRRVTS